VCAFAAIVSAAIAAVAAAAALGLQLLWPSVPVTAPSPRVLHATWPRGPPHGARDRKRSREKLVGMRRVIKKASDCRRFKALISYQVRLRVQYFQELACPHCAADRVLAGPVRRRVMCT
jgi:hypothetical protein